MNEKVSVVGLGKLGLGLALSFAKAGIETIGVDVDEQVIRILNEGRSPVVEPGYDEYIKEVSKSFRVTSQHFEAIESSDITFVLVATPSVGDGRFSNRYVKSALKSLAQAFGKSKKQKHLFVISSTVIPGSIEKTFIPLIEQFSGRKMGVDFEVCFDPDFVALGAVLKDFENPDLVIIGESSPEAGDRVATIHRRFCRNNPPIHKMSLISAEIAKVSLNAYITMKISFANTIANLCEQIPGADVDAITSSIGQDKRISPYYLKGGLAFGGTCFPRDTKAFMNISRQFGIEPTLLSAVEEVNIEQNRRLASLVSKNLNSEKKVSILGLAFKDKTPVVDASPAITLLQELVIQDVDVTVYDPLALDSIKTIFGDEVSYANSINECLDSSPVCVLALMSDVYKNAIEAYQAPCPITIIDCWRQIDVSKVSDDISVVRIGSCNSSEPLASISTAV